MLRPHNFASSSYILWISNILFVNNYFNKKNFLLEFYDKYFGKLKCLLKVLDQIGRWVNSVPRGTIDTPRIEVIFIKSWLRRSLFNCINWIVILGASILYSFYYQEPVNNYTVFFERDVVETFN